MNSLDRIIAAINFETPDQTPVIPQIFGHAAILNNVPLKNYLQNGKVLAKCQLDAVNYYKYDAVFALMDASVETEAFGSKLRYIPHEYPVVEKHILGENPDPNQLQIPDPYHSGRLPEVLKAIRILDQKIGDKILVVGEVIGPMTLTTQLLGIEKALYLAVDNPAQFEEILKLSTDFIIEYGIAQIEAGTKVPMVFDPSSTPDVIPPSFFREIVLPQLKKIFAAFKKAGGINWLHIAGPTESILPYYSQVGVDLVNFDYIVTPEVALKHTSSFCVNGNLRSLCFLEGNLNAMKKNIKKLLTIFNDQPGFILSSGCEIPPEAPSQSIMTMVQFSRSGR